MIQYEKKILANGLTVILHQDTSATMAAVNMLYKVGSKNEEDGKTGLAHLFEHLMFEGDQFGDRFDKILQRAGGDNNAFTSSDITNYYDVIPPENIETALYLEAGRMTDLDLSDENIETQLNVVIEEFKETCINVPYGDAWHEISKMSYSEHAYQWPVIGRSIDELRSLVPEDFRSFYHRYYNASNAILVISSPLEYSEIWDHISHWFGDKPSMNVQKNISVSEPEKRMPTHVHITENVPMESLWITFPMCGRSDDRYYANDIVSDILGTGKSSRFYQSLVKNQQVALIADSFVSGTMDPGLLVIEAKPSPGISLEALENAIWAELDKMVISPTAEDEVEKHITRIESGLQFGETDALRKAMHLAYFEALGNVEKYDNELASYRAVTADDIQLAASDILKRNKSSTLYYRSDQN